MNDFRKAKDDCRRKLVKYTLKAFNYIPERKNAHMLDLGCGTGVPALELMKSFDCKITAVDNDTESLNWFRIKTEESKLSEKITIIHDSIGNISFPEQHFDIILAEGIFNIVGFEYGLTHFYRLLKNPGYFVIHDEANDFSGKKQIIEQLSLKIISTFVLDKQVWWEAYYDCLEKNIKRIRKKYSSVNFFAKELNEIEKYKKNPSTFSSRYYVLKQKDI